MFYRSLVVVVLLLHMVVLQGQSIAEEEAQLQAIEQLQESNAKQGNYKAAYELSRQRSVLLQEKSRRYVEEQRQKYESARVALEAQKKTRK